jgi:alkanesulfonate monooxygenase SsuD/methylene tetrahydromethanopterin reductase-like flavin-dependent oxidoreductase (luciferase family)
VRAYSRAADFSALGADFASCFRRIDESLATMRRLWTGERVGAALCDDRRRRLGLAQNLGAREPRLVRGEVHGATFSLSS